MLLSFLLPFLLSPLIFALKHKQFIPDVPTFQLCNQNVNSTYFVVGKIVYPKSAPDNLKNTLPIAGFSITLAKAACATFGLRLANLTEQQLPEIYNMSLSCNATAAWLDVYEGLVAPFHCYSLAGPSLVNSINNECEGLAQYKAICQVPDDVVETVYTVTSTTLQTTSTSTSFSTTYETDTTVITDYEFVRVTSTITEGTYDVTCITSTRTIVHTVHKRPHHHHHHHDSSSSSSSSRWFKSNKNKTPTLKSAQKAETFVACTRTFDNFFLVENTNIGNDTTAEDACNAIGYSVANVTEPILRRLSHLFTYCNAPSAVAGFWYSYEPQGCLTVGKNGASFVEDPNDPVYDIACLNQHWALCHAGEAIISVVLRPASPDMLRFYTFKYGAFIT